MQSTSDVFYKFFFLPVKWILTFTSHTSKQVRIVHLHLAQQCIVTKSKYGCQCVCINREWIMPVYNAHKWTLAIPLHSMNCNHKSKALFWMVMDYNKQRICRPHKMSCRSCCGFSVSLFMLYSRTKLVCWPISLIYLTRFLFVLMIAPTEVTSKVVRYKTCTKHFQEIKLIQLPMIRIGGNGQLTGVVMATTASFCFKFNLVSRMSLHCLYKRTQYHTHY